MTKNELQIEVNKLDLACKNALGKNAFSFNDVETKETIMKFDSLIDYLEDIKAFLIEYNENLSEIIAIIEEYKKLKK